MNQFETLEKYEDLLEKAKKEKLQAEHRMERLEQRIAHREKMPRKERTHSLVVKGAILERYFPEIKNLTEPHLSEVMSMVISEKLREEVRNAIRQLPKEAS